MTRKHWLIASLPLLVGSLATACGDDTSSTTETDSDGSTSTTTTTTTTTDPTDSSSSSTTTTTTTSTTTATSTTTDDPTTGPPPPTEAEFIVTIENISGDTWFPTGFSPLVWVEHDLGSQPVFAVGGTASPGLVELAEDGVTATLATEMGAVAEVVQAGEYNMAETGGAGPLAPGDSYVFNVTAQSGSRLSLASMMLESNDIFVGTGPNGVSLFTNAGFPEDERDVTLNLEFWEAGSEANQAPPGGAYQGSAQTMANEGPAESGAVSLRSESTHQIPQAARLVTVDVAYNMDLGQFAITLDNLDGAISSDWGGLVHAMHDDTQSLFEPGMTIDTFTGLEALVEDGEPGAMETALTGVVDQVGTEIDVAAGGQVIITVVPNATDPLFSFVANLSETNDAFLGTATGIALLDDMGNPRNIADIEEDFQAGLWLYDGGSETNETPGAGANQDERQAADGDGVATTDPIALYNDTTNDLADIATALDIQIVNDTDPGDFIVSIDNNSDTTAYPFTLTNVVWGVQDGSIVLYTAGMPASADLEMVAEDGVTTGIEGLFTGGGAAVSSTGINDGMDDDGIAPGESVTFGITGAEATSRLTFVTMIVPSNDTFVGFDLDLFNGATPLTDMELEMAIPTAFSVYDAGTEYNQVGAAGADQPPRQAGMNTGGNEGDGTIQTANDKDPVWFYPDPTDVLRVTIAPVE